MTTGIDLLARLEHLLPSIASWAPDEDIAGQVSEATIRELADAKVFATLAPRAFGGLELRFDVFSTIVRKVSTAFNVGWLGVLVHYGRVIAFAACCNDDHILSRQGQ